ncbi:ubiquinone biosynthesis protein [Alkalithermobacter thermoalcaliphilus JW-YL-7 = DSM 7308]|uniref:ABC-1 domain-containing protein n=1 Tax=Alkalithermobacter thermoalcaliphilus JW-YL-7 = DSM 7308 TaxID=1121328 RepID=A0A150FQV4_CLOPD|nr:ABC-1 domain-containing protein [[Clostridium] paradoxum JW-YL-7 = DSM 7308]SHK51981.1 ubiquinone biosynthesis protein [[Clostridium] paradoxum JW-YL-7 = DSM 7308]
MIKVSYKNIKRYKEIAQVLIKYGFAFVVEKLKIDGIAYKIPIVTRENIKYMSTGERIRRALEELGPTFIKLGQILSTRHDLLEPSIIEELSKLQSNVSTFEFEYAKEIFKDEIGLDFEDVFSYFNPKVIGSASIGQVYEGRLKTGQEVIVKIQRPNIENLIRTDLEILYSIGKAIDEHYKDSLINFCEIIEEFSVLMLRELDYNFEARNCEKFMELFKNDKNIHIPKVYWDYTSKRVLTLEKIKGVQITDFKKIENNHWDSKKIANIGALSFMKQIFIHGFFHADPHPGNIIIVGNEKIAFIDFGIVGFIDSLTLGLITDMLFASINKDIERIITVLMDLNAIQDNTNLIKLREDMSYLIHYYYNIPIKKINLSEVINEFMRFIRKNNIKLPSQFATLAKAIITIEGSAKVLNPDFCLPVIFKDFLKEFYINKFNPSNIFSSCQIYLSQLARDIKFIPKQVRLILKNLEKNEIKLTIDDKKFISIEKAIYNMTNKLSISLIISSLLVGSSLVITTNVGPKLKGYPLLGVIGYTLASFMGIILVVSIIFSNKNNQE